MDMALMPVSSWNLITVSLILVFAASVWQGARRGAKGSAKQLVILVMEGAVTVLSLLLAWVGMRWFSPLVRDWLVGLDIVVPNRELNLWSQMYYTLVTGLRDFSLMRSAAVFMVFYLFCSGLTGRITWTFMAGLLDWHNSRARIAPGGGTSKSSTMAGWTSIPLGAAIGSITGAGRALLLIGGVLVFVSLYPETPLSRYAAESSLYQRGAKQVIQPFTGDVLEKLPVLTQSVEKEFNQILKRKYEIIDARIPDDIAAAAIELTAGKQTDEDKARALYSWVGTRIQYDWEKVRLYEEDRIWKEQTPEETFQTREGVCIDYSRLYAMMARSVGLEVKVVTGMGYDGRGGMGPHAWNEVYLSELGQWVPLDSTWVSSGGNWFNPPNFYETHIKET